MARTAETSSTDEVHDSSDFLEKPGFYHCLVPLMKDSERPYKDDHFNGYSIQGKVVEGDEMDKSFGLSFDDPDSSHKDGGAFCRRRQTALFIATNLMTPADLGKPVEINEAMAAGAQVVVKLKKGSERDDGSFFLDLDQSKIFHVDDPRVKDVPKNEELLKQIPAAYRRDEAFFQPILPVSASAKPVTPPPTFNQDGL